MIIDIGMSSSSFLLLDGNDNYEWNYWINEWKLINNQLIWNNVKSEKSEYIELKGLRYHNVVLYNYNINRE